MLPLLIQSMPITTNVNVNPAHGEICSIPHCVIKFVSDLQQFRGFLRGGDRHF